MAKGTFSSGLNIGNDVWLGAGTQVLRGVTLGHGSVVGEGIVTKDIPPYEIWAGVPAKKIGQRFSDEIISDLLQVGWWNLPTEVIREHIKLFQREVDSSLLKDLRSLSLNGERL